MENLELRVLPIHIKLIEKNIPDELFPEIEKRCMIRDGKIYCPVWFAAKLFYKKMARLPEYLGIEKTMIILTKIKANKISLPLIGFLFCLLDEAIDNQDKQLENEIRGVLPDLVNIVKQRIVTAVLINKKNQDEVEKQIVQKISEIINAYFS